MYLPVTMATVGEKVGVPGRTGLREGLTVGGVDGAIVGVMTAKQLNCLND
jgi:hypothetical protein